MTAPTQALEVVHNLILDTIQPFIARLETAEATVNALREVVYEVADEVTRAPQSHEQTSGKVETPEKPLNGSTVLPEVVEAVLALHRLDAVPLQWVFRNGKREEAPEGAWEITCAVCKDHNIEWHQGDADPPRCKTVQTLLRGVQ